MAMDAYAALEKRNRSGSVGDLEDPNHFSWEEDSEEERLNELDPLRGKEQFQPSQRHSSRPRIFRRNTGDKLQDQVARKIDKLRKSKAPPITAFKKAFKTPGRQGLVLALLIVLVLFGVVSGGGFYAYKKGGATYDGYSEPWYPAPPGGTTKSWEESYVKAAELVSKMSLLEKVNVTTGTGWMMGMCVGNTGPAVKTGFPGLCLQDGPLGIRFADHITATPAGITVGATWNKDLMYKRGRLLGLEYRSKGVNVMLGPAVGSLGRMPAGGRNFEGFGTDPVLQGHAAAMTIRGVQAEGVIATIKHFVANEQEHYRQVGEWGLPNAISSNIDDRTLHEVYAWPFGDSVRAGVGSVMCSYNQVNNSYACQNSKLLNGVLKDEMGFQGFIQSDWGAQRSGVASALAGLDMSMPGDKNMPHSPSVWGPELTRAIMNGTVPTDRLDDMTTRIVAAWYQMGQDKWDEQGPNFSSWTNDEVGLIHPGSDDKTEAVVNKFVDASNTGDYSHRALVRRVAAEGIVLLKNDKSFLPLGRNGWSQAVGGPERKCRVAVIGEDSVLDPGGPNVCPDRACNQGTLASGWGSGAVEFPYLISPLDAIQHSLYEKDVEITSWPTNDPPSKSHGAALAEQDICLVFANADSGEGFRSTVDAKGDRNDLDLQKGGKQLVADVAAHCGGPVVLVIHAVGPVIIDEFAEHPNVHAILHAHLPGQESGRALQDVLLGDVNPSGKLPYTMGKSLKDYGEGGQILYYPNGIIPQQNFEEGLMIDYRWFDYQNITPTYPFGHGLSYTTFALEDIRITPTTPEGRRPDALPARRPTPEIKPPTYHSTLPDPQELLFPAGWRKLKSYIYPYITSVSDVEPVGDYPYPDMTPHVLSQAGGGEGGNPALWDVLATVEVTVVNTGDRDGQAVPQLYIAFPQDVYEDAATPLSAPAPINDDSHWEDYGFASLERTSPGLERRDDASPKSAPSFSLLSSLTSPASSNGKDHIIFPPRVLRAFDKVHTYSAVGGKVPRDGVGIAGDRQTVKFELTRRDLSYWSVRHQNWVLPTKGSFGVQVGLSSRDIKVEGTLW